ncbi:MAG: universal stress protein [Nocardioidaceae bacterium]|nr:universal stress protein [Nocardioidaceae bacterium]
MTTSTTTPVVIVGVDTSAQSLAAARFGLDAARCTRSALVLAHAWSVLDSGGRSHAAELRTAEAEATKVVDDLVAGLDGPSGVEVSTHLQQGHPAGVLIGLSSTATLMVVGRHDWWLERLWDGRVSADVQRLAGCPVVAVPERWRPETGWRGPVVVAADLDHSTTPVLTQAFATADSTGSELVVVHATDAEADETAAAADVDVLESHLAPFRDDTPSVVVRVVTAGESNGDAVRALVDCASVVVVAVPRPEHRTGSMIARLLDDGGCPLVVVPSERPQHDR